MVRAHKIASGKAGLNFWTAIFIPLFGFALLRLSGRDVNSKAAQIAA
jgi:hypothetical protein